MNDLISSSAQSSLSISPEPSPLIQDDNTSHGTGKLNGQSIQQITPDEKLFGEGLHPKKGETVHAESGKPPVIERDSYHELKHEDKNKGEVTTKPLTLAKTKTFLESMGWKEGRSFMDYFTGANGRSWHETFIGDWMGGERDRTTLYKMVLNLFGYSMPTLEERKNREAAALHNQAFQANNYKAYPPLENLDKVKIDSKALRNSLLAAVSNDKQAVDVINKVSNGLETGNGLNINEVAEMLADVTNAAEHSDSQMLIMQAATAELANSAIDQGAINLEDLNNDTPSNPTEIVSGSNDHSTLSFQGVAGAVIAANRLAHAAQNNNEVPLDIENREAKTQAPASVPLPQEKEEELQAKINAQEEEIKRLNAVISITKDSQEKESFKAKLSEIYSMQASLKKELQELKYPSNGSVNIENNALSQSIVQPEVDRINKINSIQSVISDLDQLIRKNSGNADLKAQTDEYKTQRDQLAKALKALQNPEAK